MWLPFFLGTYRKWSPVLLHLLSSNDSCGLTNYSSSFRKWQSLIIPNCVCSSGDVAGIKWNSHRWCHLQPSFSPQQPQGTYILQVLSNKDFLQRCNPFSSPFLPPPSSIWSSGRRNKIPCFMANSMRWSLIILSPIMTNEKVLSK